MTARAGTLFSFKYILALNVSNKSRHIELQKKKKQIHPHKIKSSHAGENQEILGKKTLGWREV